MKEWLMNRTSELGCYCNQVPCNNIAYNVYLLTCKLIRWL